MAVVWVCLLLVSAGVCDVMSADMLLSHSGMMMLFKESSAKNKNHFFKDCRKSGNIVNRSFSLFFSPSYQLFSLPAHMLCICWSMRVCVHRARQRTQRMKTSSKDWGRLRRGCVWPPTQLLRMPSRRNSLTDWRSVLPHFVPKKMATPGRTYFFLKIFTLKHDVNTKARPKCHHLQIPNIRILYHHL